MLVTENIYLSLFNIPLNISVEETNLDANLPVARRDSILFRLYQESGNRISKPFQICLVCKTRHKVFLPLSSY